MTCSSVTFPVTVTLLSCVSTSYVSISVIYNLVLLLSNQTILIHILDNHNSVLTDDSRRWIMQLLPSIFLMAFSIFLMHSSQCKFTFISTTCPSRIIISEMLAYVASNTIWNNHTLVSTILSSVFLPCKRSYLH